MRNLRVAMRGMAATARFRVEWLPFFLNKNLPDAGVPLEVR